MKLDLPELLCPTSETGTLRSGRSSQCLLIERAEVLDPNFGDSHFACLIRARGV